MLTYRVLIDWPLTDKLIVIYLEYRWVIFVQDLAIAGVLSLSIALGIIGFLRRGWLPKLLSGYALYHAVPMFLWNFSYYFWWDWNGLWMDFTWYVFDIPIAWIHRHVGTDGYMRTSLYAVYLLVIYLALRQPAKYLTKRLWPFMLRIEDHLLERYPFMERWNRPVL
jgi:hypothetical protein